VGNDHSLPNRHPVDRGSSEPQKPAFGCVGIVLVHVLATYLYWAALGLIGAIVFGSRFQFCGSIPLVHGSVPFLWYVVASPVFVPLEVLVTLLAAVREGHIGGVRDNLGSSRLLALLPIGALVVATGLSLLLVWSVSRLHQEYLHHNELFHIEAAGASGKSNSCGCVSSHLGRMHEGDPRGRR